MPRSSNAPLPPDALPAALVDVNSPIRSVLAFIVALVSPQNRKATIILCYAVFALTLWKYLPSAPRFADPETGKCVVNEQTFKIDNIGVVFGNSNAVSEPLNSTESLNSTPIKPLDGTLTAETTPLRFLWGARKHWAAFFLMGVFPMLIVKFVFREKLSDYGVCWGERKRTILSFLTLAPIFFAVGWASGLGDSGRAFYTVYPYNPAAGVSWNALILHSISYFCLYYFAWEFMFRGFLLRGLAPTTGFSTAIWIQVVISTALHFGHPASETFGCVAGGLLWGFFALRTRSIFAGWGQHALLGIALDWSLILAAC
ncbi:MAG: CPBP family intramembrane metalloprotease [Thermoguttaceae bacterium]|nr:CPBP family intramembrane metalloprotease [Thermoguttaceae bacterium]